MDIFNNREIATLIWFSIFAVWVFAKSEARESLGDVVKAFSNWKVCLPVALLVVYVAACVYGLSIFDIWVSAQLKNTIIWTASVGIASLVRIGTIENDPRFLRKWIEDNLKITVVVEFIVAVPTFPLLVELVVVLLLTFLVMLQAVAESRDEYQSAAKIVNWLLALAGLTMLSYTVFIIFDDLHMFATMQTARDFYTPPLLSFLVIPFLFVFYVTVSYETSLSCLEVMEIEPDLRSYSKWRAIIVFRHRVDLLKRWSRDVRSFSLPDKAAVRDSMSKVCELWRREQDPPAVDSSLGWSPYVATKFLEHEGFVPGDYHGCGDSWYASTHYQELGKGVFPNNIAYYVDGTEHVATQLKLVLNVNNPDEPSESELRFRELASELAWQALPLDAEQDITADLVERDDGDVTVDDKKFSVSKDDWSAGINNGYRRRFVIEHLASEAS